MSLENRIINKRIPHFIKTDLKTMVPNNCKSCPSC